MNIIRNTREQVERFELPTFCLENRHSDQLNYTCNTRQRVQRDSNAHQLGSQPRTLPIKLYTQHNQYQYSTQDKTVNKLQLDCEGFEPPWVRPILTNSWERPISVCKNPFDHSGNSPCIQLTGLEPAHNNDLIIAPLPIGLQLHKYRRLDLNQQNCTSKAQMSTSCITTAYAGSQIRTGTVPILSRLSLPLDYTSSMGDRGLEPLKSIRTTILQTVAVAAVPITRGGRRWSRTNQGVTLHSLADCCINRSACLPDSSSWIRTNGQHLIRMPLLPLSYRAVRRRHESNALQCYLRHFSRMLGTFALTSMDSRDRNRTCVVFLPRKVPQTTRLLCFSTVWSDLNGHLTLLESVALPVKLQTHPYYTILPLAQHCEINGLTCNSRIALTCQVLKSILSTVSKLASRISKLPEGNNDCDGRTVYDRRGCLYPQIHEVYRKRDVQARGTKGKEDRQELAYSTRGPARPYREGVRRQKIKPVANWLGTTKKFFVVNWLTLTQSGKLVRDGPRYALPVSSIANTPNLCQVIQEDRISDRKECIMCILSIVSVYTQYYSGFRLFRTSGSEAGI